MPVNKVNLTQLDNIEGESPAIFETKIELNTQQLKEMEKSLARTSSGQNEYKNFAVKIAVSYDVKETKFMQKWFWVINKSKFTSCYPAAWSRGNDEELSLASGEHFNRVSAAPFLINILNNKKPAIPELDDRNITLVAVNEDWKEGRITKRKASMNRLRFYFKRGRLTSGKGERIGFVLNEPASKYNDLWVANQLVSTVGKDIVSDSASVYDGLYRTKAVLLNKSNFVIHDPYDIDFPDLESFSPKYIEDLGIMTYLPKFDKKNNCWYLEIELDINDQTGKELHSPFVRFAMVHYQENSQVYLSEGVAGDCRISEIQKSGYVYIMGTRTVSLDIRPSEVRIKLQYDITSLKKSHFGQTRFYAVAQKKADGEIKWHIADRDKKDDKGAFVMLESIPSSVQKLTYLRSGGDYRLVILETEEWDHTIDTDFESLINNKNNRIVFVSLFDI
jgi:hypothetical protein